MSSGRWLRWSGAAGRTPLGSGPLRSFRRWAADTVNQGAGELPSASDVEFPVHLTQVEIDRVGAEEQLGGDLPVGSPFARKTGHDGLLRGELDDEAVLGSRQRAAGGEHLAARPGRQERRACGVEGLIGGA